MVEMDSALLPEEDEPMADRYLSPADRLARDTVRQIAADTIRPAARAVDVTPVFPAEGFKALARADLAGMLVPAGLGGSAHSMNAYVAVMEEIAAGCASTYARSGAARGSA